MNSPVSSVSPPSKKASTNKDSSLSTTKRIENTHTSELVIALCGPIGSPLHKVSEALKKCLIDDFNYDKCEVVRLSTFIERHASGSISSESEYKRISGFIREGNALRDLHRSSILAELAVGKIARDREAEAVSKDQESPGPRRVCHIIDSIKNQEELDILRAVYRDMLYFVGVFSPLTVREKTLEEKGMTTAEIYGLIDQDSGEEVDYGQTVRDTFPQADFFLRIDEQTNTQVDNKVERFLDLILGSKIVTPTVSETAMYMAASASGNSACLSRQVGAALTDADGNLLSVGWNDVPKSGGGLYGADMVHDSCSQNDRRCWNQPGNCSNDVQKKIITKNVVTELIKEGVVDKSKEEMAYELIRKNGKLRGLIEFSRSVHAEMHAIINAGRQDGSKIMGGKLYCTTYPCHSCARHIIAAGIAEVYYIEPYRKSLATRLHGDSITENETESNMVRILPYDGVAPARYLDLFRVKIDSRKDKHGNLVVTKRSNAEPRISKTLEALPTLEGLVVGGLIESNLIDIGGVE